jgi:hypothetical protein
MGKSIDPTAPAGSLVLTKVERIGPNILGDGVRP